ASQREAGQRAIRVADAERLRTGVAGYGAEHPRQREARRDADIVDLAVFGELVLGIDYGNERIRARLQRIGEREPEVERFRSARRDLLGRALAVEKNVRGIEHSVARC